MSEKIYQSKGKFTFWNNTRGEEITSYVVGCTWSGNLDAAARVLNFSILFTVSEKDAAFKNCIVEPGDRVQLRFTDENGDEFLLFDGRIFLRNRNSESYTMEFKAFDNLIYLAKSELQEKFSKVPAKFAISEVCKFLGVTLGTVHDDLNITVDFISDGMKGTEIIKKCLDAAKAETGLRYKCVMAANSSGRQVLNIVRADEIITNYKISDVTNLTGAAHGTSVEDMINQICVVKDNGEISGYITVGADVEKYGLLQKVYKHNAKQDTATAARSLLQGVKEHSQLSAVGNIQCVSGYAVEVEEEQLTGKFLIVSDSHKISNGIHTMDLTLEYLDAKNYGASADVSGNVNPVSTKRKGG